MPPAPSLLAILTQTAIKAAARAYAPYSHFQVGAALLFEDGTIVAGSNVENASYGLSCCAERNAIFRAVSERGASGRIAAVAVFHGGPEPCPPCGACLQVISEFAAEPCAIYFSHANSFRSATLDELLPMRFNKAWL